jgi:hypothetical protein
MLPSIAGKQKRKFRGAWAAQFCFYSNVSKNNKKGRKKECQNDNLLRKLDTVIICERLRDCSKSNRVLADIKNGEISQGERRVIGQLLATGPLICPRFEWQEWDHANEFPGSASSIRGQGLHCTPFPYPTPNGSYGFEFGWGTGNDRKRLAHFVPQCLDSPLDP